MDRKKTDLRVMPGVLVDVGSYQCHAYMKGQGDAAMVFIAGSGTPCAFTDFYGLQEHFSKDYLTVSFDHAGSGFSSKTEEPRTIENLTAELERLIDSVASEKEVILVSHSLGSLEAIAYAKKHPERVKCIIFLDGGSPEYYASHGELGAKLLNRGSAFLRFMGWNRLVGTLGVKLPFYGENERYEKLSEEVKPLDEAMFYHFTGNPETLHSIDMIQENAAIVSEDANLVSIPLLIIGTEGDKEWTDDHEELAKLSSNSRVEVIAGASHYLHWSNREDVVGFMEEFFEELFVEQRRNKGVQ